MIYSHKVEKLDAYDEQHGLADLFNVRYQARLVTTKEMKKQVDNM